MHRIHIHTTAVRTIQRRPSSDRSPLQPSSPAAVAPHSTAVSRLLHLEGGRSRAWFFCCELAKSLCGAAPGSVSASARLVSSTPRTLTPSYTHAARTGQDYDIHDTPQQIHTATPLLHAGATLRARACASS
jgi:hypothetical protein